VAIGKHELCTSVGTRDKVLWQLASMNFVLLNVLAKFVLLPNVLDHKWWVNTSALLHLPDNCSIATHWSMLSALAG
jgi:hypothetical protein